MEGCSAWGRALRGRRVVLRFRRGCACRVPSAKICEACGAWEVPFRGSVEILPRLEIRGLHPQLLVCPMPLEKILKYHVAKSMTFF